MRIVEAPAALLDEWDDLVAKASGGSVFQTRRWGDFWREYVGGTPRYWVALTPDGTPAGALLEISEAIVWEPFFERPLGGFLLRGLRHFARRHHVNGGPVIFDEARRVEVFDGFARHLAAYTGSALPVCTVTLTTPVAPAADTPDSGAAALAAFRRQGFTDREVFTHCVDLRCDEDVLWQNLHRSARKAVNRAVKEGITVRRLREVAELVDLYPSVRAARDRLGLRTFSLRNWTVMWKHLSPAGSVHMFVAEDATGVLGGLGIWSCGRLVQEFASVVTAAGRDTTAGDLLKWEVIRWGRTKGYAYYDLAGLNPRDDASEKERQIARFKRKWGGRDVKILSLRRLPFGGFAAS